MDSGQSLALRHTVCGVEIISTATPQRPPKARFLRAFCFSGFGFSGPGDAWAQPSWAVFLQAAFRQSPVAGRGDSEVGSLGVPVQGKALLQALQSQGFGHVTRYDGLHDIRCQEGQFS